LEKSLESQGAVDTEVDELAQMLTLSAAFDDDLMVLLEKAWNNSAKRSVISLAFCKAAVEHAISQRVLIESGLHGTALSLIRLQFETVVRAAWVLHGAKDEWLIKFSSPVADGDFNEPQMGPPVPAMLEAIKIHAPEAALELGRLNETMKVMHSFVHGGAHLVVNALRGYPPKNLVAVLQNRNLLSLMLSNVIVIASQQPHLKGGVRQLMDAHENCMPPRHAA
jgi:hypothetical protein